MASRKEAKEEARQKRLAEEAARAASAQRRQRLEILGGVVLIAVAVVVVLIAVSSGGSKTKKPPTTQKAKTAVETTVNTLLSGIPQSGTTLGNPSAPVTMTYFGDLQCPVCADFTTGASGGGFSQMVSNLVKAGKVKVVYRSFCTATCNGQGQTVFNTQQADAYAAGLQDKFWNYAELFYREQGAEDSGYVTPAFLSSLATQAGVNLDSWTSAQKNPSIVDQVASDQKLAAAEGLTGTPTVIFKGPSGKTSEPPAGIPNYQQLLASYNAVA